MRVMLSKLKRGQHPGLLLQKYAENLDTPQDKKKLMESAMAASADPQVGILYQQAYQRWEKEFLADDTHLSFLLATTNRLMVGLGSESVLEAGIRLHHTYGTPIIPGSALKGLAAHYCHEVWGQSQNEKADDEAKKFRNDGVYHRVLFGDTDQSGRGAIIFHDAWIQPDSLNQGALRLDVMTPHHPDWQIKNTPPTDFDSPIPVSFLSVSGSFNCKMSWGGPTEHSPENIKLWMNLAKMLLTKALSEWGVGAKTSSGYGRLVSPESKHKQRASETASKTVSYKSGNSVQAVLCEEKTKNLGWKAQETVTQRIGPVLHGEKIPSDKKAGDLLQFVVHSDNGKEISFKYLSVTEQQKQEKNAQSDKKYLKRN